jgi:uncharacterized protein YyaL (SSP411 family)
VNRLGHERSPYLLQHAENPVDWYPWGDEAFVKARAENKPIFLSVGYSTCHWCHVMERESFENAQVAAVLNDHFVSIKVDREERPDVDRVYMTFVQATTGSGGWPMSVWLTTDLKPFYGGTYFPPSSRWGRPGFIEILQEIARVWESDHENVVRSADALTHKLQDLERSAASATIPGVNALSANVRQFRQAFDERHGGFGDAPKFPRPSELLFLFREHARTGDADAREMALRTLRAMALGGVRDHVGGGFHRYSVDTAWRVPHFEKMLYDQAQLAIAYLEGAQVSGDPFYAEVAEDTLLYVLREMTDTEGGFYSAEDADSVPPEHAGEPGAHKAEGAFYLWSADEIDRLLGGAAEVFNLRFGIESHGNAPIDPQQEFVGKNLLYVARSIDDIAQRVGQSPSDVVDTLNAARVRLFEARVGRARPHLDDKVLTAWNGLMIAALSRGARLVISGRTSERDDRFLNAAKRAASFFRARMWDEKSRTLLRRYRNGHTAIEAYAEDYACLVFGLIELFQADADPRWLDWAVALQRRQDELFWDEQDGGWFGTSGNDPSVLLRMKEDYDGAEPSASSMSVLNLLFLSHLIPDESWSVKIDRTLRLFGVRLEQLGRAVPMMAAAFSTYSAGLQQIVIVGNGDRRALDQAAARRYLPFAVTISVDERGRDELAALLPLIGAMSPIDERAAAYVCRDFECRRPVTTPGELDELLQVTVAK